MESRGGGDTPEVILVSTLTVDKVPHPEGGFRDVPGGPGTYLGQALTVLGCGHHLITGERAIVRVQWTNGGEEYVIPALPPIPLPAPLEARAVILSPIMREIDPHGVPHVDGLLVIDLQGFVREPSRPSGTVSHVFELTDLLEKADIVKASREELARLTGSSRASLDNRILLETHGRHGTVVHVRGKACHVPARPVDVADTIGAGDSYLAAFVVSLIDGATPEDAAAFAARFTEDWLRQVKSPASAGNIRR